MLLENIYILYNIFIIKYEMLTNTINKTSPRWHDIQ
jgi:hypothetical protein